MMRRVARLLEVVGVPPAQILAVTFTRAAAHDLVDKLTNLGVPGADQVSAKTLHSLSFSILGRAAVFEATGRIPRPLLGCELNRLRLLWHGGPNSILNVEAEQAADRGKKERRQGS
jgi:hypothetical protein